MQKDPCSCNNLCLYSLILLVSMLGTVIFTAAALIGFLIIGIFAVPLVYIAAIFFIVSSIMQILHLKCALKENCIPRDYKDRP